MDDVPFILRHYQSDCRPIQAEPLGNNGGMSGAKFWRITAPRGTLILRRWPREHPDPTRLQFIHDAVRHAARSVDFLPVAVETRDGQSFTNAVGHLWELAPWMPGTADYELAPSDAKLRAAMTALAQFHNAGADFQPSRHVAAMLPVAGPPAIPRRLARLRNLLRGEVDELASAISDDQWPEFAQLARRFLAALPRALPRALAQLEPLVNITLQLQPCLRDIWHDHVLFTGDRVTGLVDFGAVDIDTPTTDIARLLGSFAGEPALPFRENPIEVPQRTDVWHRGLAAYSATRPLSNDESLAVTALNTANPILAGCNWVRWVYVERRSFEDAGKIFTRFQRLVTQLSA